MLTKAQSFTQSHQHLQHDRVWASLETSNVPATVAVQDEASEHASDEALAESQFIGPGSAHSWLKQAWSCLGRVRQHVFQSQSASTGSAPCSRPDGTIFSHGDRALREDLEDRGELPQFSENTIDLIVRTYFDRALATYRFLHRPTIIHWFQCLRTQDSSTEFPAVRSAIVLFSLSLGSMHLTEADKAQIPPSDAEIIRNEILFHLARKKLSEERGTPSVESVQARLMQVHYYLASSRPNRAWYAFGTVVQLVFALGLHQKGYGNTPGLARELRRRAFWSVYKTDKSLSIALGRPSLIREECITQELPEIVNDDQIFANHIDPDSEDDCLMEADVAQVKLARIIGRSMREYYETNDNALIQLIVSNNERLAEWKSQIPLFLSGTIKPSSLIPVLRRQATVLKLFHLHTIIFINRPLLLKSFSDAWSLQQDHQIQSSIDACIKAAAEIAKQAVQYHVEGQAFRAFWLSQNITFNAVSILYLSSLRLLQAKSSLSEDEYALVVIAEDAQKCLANASEQNAPGQRYGVVLEQLRLEVRAHIDGHGISHQSTSNVPIRMANGIPNSTDTDLVQPNASIDWTNLMSEETSLHDASMFWPQFDGLPLGT